MKKLLFIILFLFSFVQADAAFDKALSSELRAEVYAQNLLDGGYEKEADEFLVKALDSYPENVTLLMFRGTALFNLKDLESAKKYFMMVLEKDFTNEQASEFIGLIEGQEEAKENKAVSSLIEYLSDKGLDFVMIFLAFLGGEIIARKYNTCTTHETMSAIRKFLQRQELSKSFTSRITFSLQQCCFSRAMFSFCSLLEILVTLTIVFALMIVWLMVEFLFEITVFLDESLNTLTSDAIWSHSVGLFLWLGVITLVLRFLMKMTEYNNKEEKYVIELSEHIEKLYTNQSYGRFYDALDYLSDEDYQFLKDFIHSDDVQETIEKYFHKT